MWLECLGGKAVKAKSLGTLSLVLVLRGMWSLNCQE